MDIAPAPMKEAISTVLRAGLSPMVTGPPGVGKSDIIRSVADQFNLKVIDMRLSQCDPTDMLGFPTHNGERMGYAPPEHFPLQGIDNVPQDYDGWLLFLDEFSSAPLSVQAAAYKLVLDRQVGKYQLHKNVAIVCAGNRKSDGAIVNRMSTAMQSRLVHLSLKVNAKDWLAWASENKIDYRICAYIESRPDSLHKFDPNHNDETFACPRTWEFASKLVKNKKDNDLSDLLPVLTGTLSEAIAREFTNFTSMCTSLPSMADIINKPKQVAIPDDPAMLYAVSHMVAAYIEESNAAQVTQYIERMPLEFATVTFRSALRINRELIKHPSVRDWANKLAMEVF
jgi:hypothetical protein